MDVLKLMDELIEREGGYVANPADRRGPTHFAITEAVARANGYMGDMRRLPQETAADIYERLYWTKPGLDRIGALAPKLAAELFETGVNMGPAAALAFLRRTLNALNRGASDYPDIAPSGLADAAFIGALTAFLKKRGPAGQTVLLKALDALQRARYVALAEARPADEAFLYGSLANRLA
jgi:lysozyme family protein